MSQKSSKFGKEGEEAAVRFLKKKKYRILETNYRAAKGEIDIIAEEGKVLAFIEVKTRAGSKYGHPLDALTPHKQAQIIKTAGLFLAAKKISNRDCRFDVVSIAGDPEKPAAWQIELLKDAFRT